MQTVGNIIWHVPLLGFVQASLVYVAGLILCATVVGAPIGLGLMEYGNFLFSPFSKAMVSKSELKVKQNIVWRIFSTIVTIVYIPFGLVLCVISVLQVALLFVSIVGIPTAIVIAKSLGTLLNPVNKRCVPQAVADELERQRAREQVGKYAGM